MPGILVVEDEAIVADDIRDTLVSLGYSVAGAVKSAESALGLVPEKQPDLILMDIHLAGRIDGIDAARQIRAKYGTPVIFLTAYADPALLERAKATEPYGYIVKPFEERELHSTIEMALHKHAADLRVRESEATMRLMVNASRDILFLITSEAKILVANEALAERAGMTVDELIGTSAFDLVAREVLTPKMACWHLVVHGEKRIDFEQQVKNGWYDVTICPVYDAKGNAGKFAVSIRNITVRRQAEELVRNNAEYYRALIDEASPVTVMLDPDGSFSRQSPSLRQALGYLPTEQLGRSFFDHVSMGDWQAARQAFSEVSVHPGMTKPVRIRFEKKDGTACVIKGIMSNLSDNPFVQKIVMNGWVE